MISPIFGLTSDVCNYEPAISLCKKHNIPFYNFIDFEPIAKNDNYFQDIGHMNNDGAIIYTQLIIKEVLNKNLNK